jgi:hypothetical protein
MGVTFASTLFETSWGKFPKFQIVTITELFAGRKPTIPLVDLSAFRRAAKEDASRDRQSGLF